VPNAFLQAWGKYRNGDIGLPEMSALVDATLTGSWSFARVKQLCAEAGFDANTICAPFGGTGSASVIPYTSAGNVNRVPSGVVQMDFAIDLAEVTAQGMRTALCGGAEHCFSGRIDSDTAPQYGGNPQVRLVFGSDPVQCMRQGAAGCTVDVDWLAATIAVGARYDAHDGCGDDFRAVDRPWLVPGVPPPGAADSTRHECWDRRLAGDPDPGANPIPDGKARVRHLELVDGVMVEQHVMTLILRETVEPFHGGAPLTSYLYVVLEKQPTDVAPEDAAGQLVPDLPDAGDARLGLTCSPDIVRRVIGRDLDGASQADVSKLARAVVGGTAGGAAHRLGNDVTVHSLCVWSEDAVQTDVPGAQNAAPGSSLVRREVVDAGPDGDRPCFPGAEVIYFTLPAGEDPAAWDCNTTRPETCLAALQARTADTGSDVHLMERARTWFPDAAADVAFDLVYSCADPTKATCSANRFDLTEGKTFGTSDGVTTFFPALAADIAQAFRYKTGFVNRDSGAQIGFAPTVCQPGSRLSPYCYDPAQILAVRDRVDCAFAIYGGFGRGTYRLDADAATALRTALTQSSSALQQDNPTGDPIVSFGFERLYAELLIMLGDDAYTASFASRFDVSGQAQLAFEGSRFEDGGIDLSGAAGYEMYKLHQAVEYYDLVTDRFYSMAVDLWQNLGAGAGDRYVTAATVTTYLDRVIRASTQSANAWSEIARRYQGLGRRDLARRVLTRAYTRAYQESLILRDLMTGIMGVVSESALPQLAAALDDAQTRYRVAMTDMKARFEELRSGTDAFGLSPDEIPFPALDEDAVNGFEVMLDRAQQRVDLADADEAAAIQSRRDFDTDQASFQSELVNLRNDYEAQLGQICGTFIGSDGAVHPAIARYAHLDPDLAKLDDPCGAAGNGDLWIAGGDLQGSELALQRVRQEIANTQAEMADAQEQVKVHCAMIGADVGAYLQAHGILNGIDRDNDRMESAITQLDKVQEIVTEGTARVSEIADVETPWGQALVASQNVIWAIGAGANLIATSALETALNVNKQRIREIETAYEAYTIGRECDYLQADEVYTLRDLHRQLLLSGLDALNAVWDVQVQFSAIQSLVNERTRLEAEWRDAEQLAVNVAAAQDDPNIRIFKNDAIINADRSFDRALLAAWQATRTYEYYTASSYADRDKLFLVRTVSVGDINLRRYVNDLEDAFYGFEQHFGNPDTRVATVSLRDDVLQIPRYGDDGEVLTDQQRVDLFRAALQDPSRLDDNGALTLKFSTTFDQLSPLTVNHKILFIEMEFFGEELGDHIGRVYLSQLGTGVVQGTDDARHFFTFPPRTAVMNPDFNGDRAFGQDSDGAITGPTRSIFRSYRFRERPFVQTDWQFVLDQRHEAVNRDINLAGLDDIVVYIYYTDFTRE
jgi:hypothetical protein